MQPVPRILGLDVGTRTIGVAVSDPMGWFARPVTTIRRGSWQEDLEQLGRIIAEFQVHHLVVGLPLGVQGELTQQARYNQRAAERIARSFSGIRISYVDESYSSQTAREQLLATGMKRRKRKQVIDQQAAVLILQDYLDQEQIRVRAEKARQMYMMTNEGQET